MLQGFSLDMHATSFLQWWINQQGQPGGSFNKRLREVSKTPILSYRNHRSSGEHEWLLKPQIFTASTEVLWDTRAVVFHGAILIGSAFHSRKSTQGFFFSTVYACSMPLAFANNFSTERHRPSLERQTSLISNRETDTKSPFLSSLRKRGASVGIQRNVQRESGERESSYMEQSMPLQAEKGSSKEHTESELFCLEKRWLGREKEMALFSLRIIVKRNLRGSWRGWNKLMLQKISYWMKLLLWCRRGVFLPCSSRLSGMAHREDRLTKECAW